MGVVAVSFLASHGSRFRSPVAFILLMAKSNPFKKFSEFGIDCFRIFYKILVQVFNKCRGRIGDIGKIFHQNKIGKLLECKYRSKPF